MTTNIKKIFNNIKNRVNDMAIEEVSQNYQYIENFDNISEDDCLKLDNKNKDIYKHNNDLYKSITDKLKKHNAMIKIETPPSPPSQPNNYERYILYKKRNMLKNVRHQSFAVNYLIEKGYKMVMDKKNNENVYAFEPYEAIDLVEKIENNNIECIIKNKENSTPPIYDNYYSQNYVPSAPQLNSFHSSTQLTNQLTTQLSSSLPSNINNNNINNTLTLQKSISELHLYPVLNNSTPNISNISQSTQQYKRNNTTY